MDLKIITQKSTYNNLATHVIQSWEWGEFRKNFGPVLRYGLYQDRKLKTAFQLTLHKIPLTDKYVGYLPKGPFPNKDLANALEKIGKEQNLAFIKLEPNIELSAVSCQLSAEFRKSPKPLFTKYNFILDLTKSEEELLKNMHSKTRYNIKIALKHGVKVEERTDNEAFEIYLKLYFETTKRQGYHGHNENYHRKVWETLKNSGMACILIAFFKNQPLSAWMLLNFKETLYYPYGGSSKIHPEVMANNLIAWQALKLGKKMELKRFDMWGADFRFGFHKFKQGYGGKLIEYIGTYDLVFNWPIYWMFTIIDKMMPIKVLLLKWISR